MTTSFQVFTTIKWKLWKKFGFKVGWWFSS